jgi:hypothetical protein
LRREREMEKLKSKIENEEDRSVFEDQVRKHKKMRKKAKKANAKKAKEIAKEKKRKYKEIKDEKDQIPSVTEAPDNEHEDKPKAE